MISLLQLDLSIPVSTRVLVSTTKRLWRRQSAPAISKQGACVLSVPTLSSHRPVPFQYYTTVPRNVVVWLVLCKVLQESIQGLYTELNVECRESLALQFGMSHSMVNHRDTYSNRMNFFISEVLYSNCLNKQNCQVSHLVSFSFYHWRDKHEKNRFLWV